MARMKPFEATLGISTEEDLLSAFIRELMPSGADYRYFLDAEKIISKASEVACDESLLACLQALRDGESDRFYRILSTNPALLPVFPRLLGLRDTVLSVIDDSGSLRRYDFRPLQAVDRSLARSIEEFCVRTGLVSILGKVDSVASYLVGLESGLDTHARKNRSGIQMEATIEHALHDSGVLDGDVVIFKQRSFGSLSERLCGGSRGFSVKLPRGLEDRRFDFVVFREGSTPVNIEVNFFGGTGSKPQEIVDSYINRQRELNAADWGFIWITDGPGWQKQASQLWKAIREIHYPLNLSFVRSGCLSAALRDIWGIMS